jgi:hypothetical protein
MNLSTTVDDNLEVPPELQSTGLAVIMTGVVHAPRHPTDRAG